jgi:hypothetical protein
MYVQLWTANVGVPLSSPQGHSDCCHRMTPRLYCFSSYSYPQPHDTYDGFHHSVREFCIIDCNIALKVIFGVFNAVLSVSNSYSEG